MIDSRVGHACPHGHCRNGQICEVASCQCIPCGDQELCPSVLRRTSNSYVIGVLDKMKADGLAAIAARKEAFAEYNAGMREAVQETVWVTGGCTRWHMDKTGKPNLYPY